MKFSDIAPEKLSDPWWRLTNLYYIQDKYGQRCKFSPWPEQVELYNSLWYLDIILKARQRGMTTFIQLFMLDRCLFNPDTSAGVIAHTAHDASIFFENKIKFAYDNLPKDLKDLLKADKSNTRELGFSNGSRITVSTSHRSGTLQYLHISEYGKLCSQYPAKAQEVRLGALNTVAPGNYVFIESTAEGRRGHFYEMCTEARKLKQMGAPLTQMDYKFHFFPWWRAKEYTLKEPVTISKEYLEYFEDLEKNHGIFLDQYQRQWYVKKSREQGLGMHAEYPSTPEEAFEQHIEGAIFGIQMTKAREERRILEIPHERGVPVDVYWDLGYNDINAMWFMQDKRGWYDFIDYYENRLEDMSFYIEQLHRMNKEQGYQWGTMYLPHDGKQHHISAIAGTAAEILRRNGFKVRVVDRPQKKIPSIEVTRALFGNCRFDLVRCDKGLIHLENYRWAYDEMGETFRKSPQHDLSSNAADAFQTFGWSHRMRGSSFAKQLTDRNRLEKSPARDYLRKERAASNPLHRHII